MEAIPVPEESLPSLLPPPPALRPSFLAHWALSGSPGAPVLARQHAFRSSSGPVLVRPECEITGAEAGV